MGRKVMSAYRRAEMDLIQSRRPGDAIGLEERMWSVAQVAEALGLAQNTVRRGIYEGRLRAYRICGTGQVRIRSGDVEALVVERDAMPRTLREDAHMAVHNRNRAYRKEQRKREELAAAAAAAGAPGALVEALRLGCQMPPVTVCERCQRAIDSPQQ